MMIERPWLNFVTDRQTDGRTEWLLDGAKNWMVANVILVTVLARDFRYFTTIRDARYYSHIFLAIHFRVRTSTDQSVSRLVLTCLSLSLAIIQTSRSLTAQGASAPPWSSTRWLRRRPTWASSPAPSSTSGPGSSRRRQTSHKVWDFLTLPWLAASLFAGCFYISHWGN